ncbi:PREDICTED: TGF-beta-activated kinase 1 and MAP3K7-binding protein 2 isoform X2 [Cyphomyrmex costatus]|uniref:TGF-beta-activated kinase 1 and MAP3K7-binding protein 2 n=1 Tax=Cyphomyrmex costatus TaxID=456900 RepID=A0A195CEX2_9HYME|nr:PREDICTED: TGF-beta-activated kinase 1 and MAP3K7-binding protein 2 isoform X2 [Cyphomyrmex costatus]KYM98608.1 TGF-beta-activated kinase 1 and MAP3K7-binding protein 2 [Cyphomyrmex costatus]
MGECHCSNITIMQLFHELKQQFPALPDHVVSQCIAQNSHDRETCARSLRATQESRPSPGAFPPPAPCIEMQQPLLLQPQQLQAQQQQRDQQLASQQRCCAMNQTIANNVSVGRPHRPASLDIGMTRRYPLVGCTRTAAAVAVTAATPASSSGVVTPSSAPAVCTSRGFFDDCCTVNSNSNGSNAPSGFELNVNVACSPAGNRDFRTAPTIGTCKRSDLVVPRSHYAEPLLAIGKSEAQIDHTRSYTSVSLTLRPPSSEPQPPIDIRSEGSSLTYSTSSLDPRGFQSRLQISIGPGNVGSVAAARIRPPMAKPIIPPPWTQSPLRSPELPLEPSSQLPRPTTTMSAPTTPSIPPTTNIVPDCSLPTTPSGPISSSGVGPPSAASSSLGDHTASDLNRSPLCQVEEHQKKLIAEQLARKERLATELRAEKGRLEVMKKEVQALARPDPLMSPQELKKKLKTEIYMLQVECERLTLEVDQWSDRRVPLGETNEEFYQGIYTGQSLPTRPSNSQPPRLPSQPPAWRLEQPTSDNDREERDETSWVCTMCTFDNHPLMNKCEECDMPRILNHSRAGETQDIHIRVTHHHNFSPRHIVHSWVV